MLTQKHLERYVDVLFWGLKISRKGKFEKNDIIMVHYHQGAARLAELVYSQILKRDMHPVMCLLNHYCIEKSFYTLANEEQLIFNRPGEKELYKNLNASITLRAPESLTHLSKVDSSKISKKLKSRKLFKDILIKRDEQGLYSWTLCSYPTNELAKNAGISLDEYSKQIIKACYLNKTNSVSMWQEIYDNAMDIKKWLNSLKIQKLHIESRNIDLYITPGEHRKWIGISGHNIPSFEIFISPDFKKTNGKYFMNQPSYKNGNYVENVRLEFKKGKAISITAESGEKFVINHLKTDSGAKMIGEFSLTDIRFSKIDRFMADTLYDENYGGKYGNCHLALGSSYSDSYSGNKTLNRSLKRKYGFNDSAIHWDMVNTENKSVTAHLLSGKTKIIYENGQFKY